MSAFFIFKALTNADTLSVALIFPNIKDFNSFEEKYLMVKYYFRIRFSNAYSPNTVTYMCHYCDCIVTEKQLTNTL